MIAEPSASGARPAIFSRVVPRRGVSSTAKPSTGAISASNRPSSMAAIARSWLASANSSMRARETPHLEAIMSALANWETSTSP